MYVLELVFNNGLLICYGKSTQNNSQTLTLPISYGNYYVGAVTAYHQYATDTNAGSDSYYFISVSSIYVNSGVFKSTCAYITFGY